MTRRGTDAVPFGCLQVTLATNGLRNLRHDGREIFRAIAVVMRDREWRTPEPVSRRVRVDWGDGAKLTITGRTPVGGAAMDWRIVAHSGQGVLRVTATCTARGAVLTNRCGLVVLLPVDRYAGAHCRVTRSSGRMQTTRLPVRIAPHQPLRDVTALSIAARDGTRWRLAFTGEVFEMEDQRNWLDPTFKLYSRPLALPVPYRVRDGETFEQSIDWACEANAPVTRRSAAPRSVRGVVPALGLATVPGRVPRDPVIVDMLRAAAPAFLLHRAGTHRDVEAAARLCADVDAELRLECIYSAVDMPGALARAMSPAARAVLASIALFVAAGNVTDSARRAFPGARTVGGTWSDFVQLNRRRVQEPVDRIAFALCPTVHARDDRTLIESLDAMRDVFRAARRIAGGRAIDAGPSSLRRRLVPRNGRPAVRPRAPDGTPYDVDPRQQHCIAAAWLAGAIAHAAAARVASLCAFEAAGPRGLVSTRADGPNLVRAISTPAHAVFSALALAQGAALQVFGVDASIGAAFAVGTKPRELWLVELAGRRRRLLVDVASTVLELAVWQGDATWRALSISSAPSKPGMLRVGPYGIVRLMVAVPLQAIAVEALAQRWLDKANCQ